MKSLRLHKYTDRLLGLTYDDLLTLTDKYAIVVLNWLINQIKKLAFSMKWFRFAYVLSRKMHL